MARHGRWNYEFHKLPFGFIQYQFASDTAAIVSDNIGTSLYDNWREDSVGFPVTDGNLNIGRYTGWSITGVSEGFGSPGTAPYVKANNYYPARYRGDLLQGYPFGWPTENPATLSSTMAARTNPSRPSIIPGSLIQDMVDMPRMIKSIGDLLRSGRSAIGAQGVANNALAAKFGWIPLFDDVSKLLDVGNQIDRRNTELRGLRQNGGIRRRANLVERSNTDSVSVIIDSGFPLYMSGTLSVTNRAKQWGTMRWGLTDPAYANLTDAEILALAKRTVLGATASGAFASSWDLIPWTWLGGWFTNAHDYVLAHGNTVPSAPYGNICIMTENRQERCINNIHMNTGLTGGDGSATFSWKQRSVFSKPVLDAHLPYLTADRLSTLALLAVQRLRR